LIDVRHRRVYPITLVAPEKDVTDFWNQTIQTSQRQPPTSRDIYEPIN
jgi:hypothetical protein